jgi:serine phosphatase RsbU (regulator of sigma subunit)
MLAPSHALPEREYLGRRPDEVFGDLGRELLSVCQEVLSDGIPVSEVERFASAAAQPTLMCHWLISAAPVTLEGRRVGMTFVVQDITSRKRAEQRTAFLARAGEILDSSLDFRLTLERVARLAVPEIADWCSISMLNDSGHVHRLAVAHADPEKDRQAQELLERESLSLAAPAGAASVMRDGATQVIDDFTDALLIESLHDPISREIVRGLGLRSSISVPLVARGRLLGAISLLSATAYRFDAGDVQLAEELARRAAVNIDNSRLYTEHTRIAHTLQQGLHPGPLPPIPGLRLASRYRPAGELNEVGGDFYDAYLRSADEWLVAIGDVTGHGARAAATTAMIRYTLRAAALHPGSTSALLHEVNRAMLAQEADYCTLALLSIRSSPSGPPAMTICLAGHPRPLLLSGRAGVQEVGMPGTMLGAFEDLQLVETPLALAPGDVLLLYTDGLTDSARWDPADLQDWLAGAQTGDLEALLTDLEHAATGGAARRLHDDIAVLALQTRSED